MFGSGSFNELAFNDVIAVLYARCRFQTDTSISALTSPSWKPILNSNGKLVYAAEINPWSVSDRSA